MKRVLALLGWLAAASQAPAQAPELPIEPSFLFPVSLLCGPSVEGFQEGVVRGGYDTLIHVANPSADQLVRIAKTVTTALPYQKGLPHGDILEDELAPGEAFTIECNELRQMAEGQMASTFRTGYLVIWSDGPVDVTAGWSGAPRGDEIRTLTRAAIDGVALCPFELGEPASHAYADQICLPFSWTCENPEELALEIEGVPRGAISLARTEDHLLGDGASTFCASTTALADGPHTLTATLTCEAIAPCRRERAFDVANTPFRLISARSDRKRYRGSDTVRITAAFSESLDALEADFTILDTGFEEDRLSIEETSSPGTYLIEYDIDGIDNTNPAGIYPVPFIATDQGVTRHFNGLRIGYVGETRNLLTPADQVPTSTRVGRFPTSGTSLMAEITDITSSNSLILPLTTLTVTGNVGGDFIEGRPRAEVAPMARNFALIWRERDLSSAGAHRLRPAMLELDCATDGEEICDGATFTVELEFPSRLNDIAKEGPHDRRIDFALLDPAGGVSETASVELQVVVLSEEMYAGTPQSDSGASEGGTVGTGVEFRLGEGILDDVEGNALTLVLTWDGEDGSGAEVIPGEDGDPQTLNALDLNIGIHRAPSDGHGGWFGNLGNAELVRKSNTCFSGLGLGQFSDDRWNCVCSDPSNLNMEVITYPPGVDLDVGGDGEGTFGAEYYIYDSCGSQEDTTATLTAYYCGSAEQHSFEIDAALSEENEELSENWNNACLFGSPCHDPKTVPTAFNETGGFYDGFDFNPTDCSALPVVAGHLGYRSPVNAAVNNPSAAPPELQNDDPALDQSWAFFDPNLSETGWTEFDVPFAKVEIHLVDGSEALVGETFTDEDGNFSLILPSGFADEGESGLVRVEVVALSSEPHNYRVVAREEDLADTGTEDLYRAVLADDFDPVANGGQPFDAMLNGGPEDEANKEIAAAFHIFRNGVVAAQHMVWLGSVPPPYSVIYDRDVPFLDGACQHRPTYYSGDFTHIRSIGADDPVFVCDQALAPDGNCPGSCVANGDGETYDESRADFAYDTHMHEYAHHVFTQLTSIGPRVFEGRAEASHFGTTSEKTSLTEGIAEAFGQMLASKEIYGQYGSGIAMNTSQISCNRDDIIDCDLGLQESVDWLTVRDKSDIVRPGPDWQPQKDCPPGEPGCGCFLGTCNQPGTACQAGYCTDTTGLCLAGSLGCAPDGGECNTDGAAEVGGACILAVTYSDGWTWRVLWDLIDEGEGIQPEVSHWRTSQMSDSEPEVPDPYDLFGNPEDFWRLVMRTTGDGAVDPVATGPTHPNLADLITRLRCDLDGETRAALDVYLEVVVEFPYHDPTVCP
jgi:hypothetical protein